MVVMVAGQFALRGLESSARWAGCRTGQPDQTSEFGSANTEASLFRGSTPVASRDFDEGGVGARSVGGLRT